MKTKLKIKTLFAYSKRSEKYFYTEFSDTINIIHGKNTSGKSTIFQAIIYTLGINDNNDNLSEILAEDVFFRVDCLITKNGIDENITFIREYETMFIKRGNRPVLRFSGINSDKSVEHIKLKKYMNRLFEFSLKLENKKGYNIAPIEAMFLPYYVSQSVGWVYLRKSFSNLDFYRNFKEDYLDYYLGIESSVDREKKHELEKELRCKEEEIKFYTRLEKNNNEFQLTKLVDEQFIHESQTYIELHKENQMLLNEYEEIYISKCNEQSYYQERQRLLRKISKNHKSQNPIEGLCPTCKQKLQFSMDASYRYFQEENDTEMEVKKCKEKIKDLQSKINSMRKNIDELRTNISKEYEILRKYFNYNISYDSWMKNKVNTQLINDIQFKLGELVTKKLEIEENLKKFKTDEEVEKSRLDKSKEFLSAFLDFLNDLRVKPLKEDRFKLLYQISAFPSQGVELHKTVLAYNFAFNKLIEKTENIHRFPFMLDAIFKEDIEQENRNSIIKFIGEHKPDDTQLILSIAETKENENNIRDYNKKYFSEEAKLICVGEGVKERAFLGEYSDNENSYLEETLNIMDGEE